MRALNNLQAESDVKGSALQFVVLAEDPRKLRQAQHV